MLIVTGVLRHVLCLFGCWRPLRNRTTRSRYTSGQCPHGTVFLVALRALLYSNDRLHSSCNFRFPASNMRQTDSQTHCLLDLCHGHCILSILFLLGPVSMYAIYLFLGAIRWQEWTLYRSCRCAGSKYCTFSGVVHRGLDLGVITHRLGL